MDSRKFRFGLTILTMLVIAAGNLIFINLSDYFLSELLKKQIAEDNRVIGEHFLEFFIGSEKIQANKEKKLELIQQQCNEIKLPNGGFICAVDGTGNVVAFPGKHKDQHMSMAMADFSPLSSSNKISFDQAVASSSFSGTMSMMGKTDIIAQLPVPESELKISVHQNFTELKKRIRAMLQPLYYFGILLTVLIGAITYIAIGKLIGIYELKLEKINAELAVTNENLSITAQQRRETLHILCHDLVNPLFSIYGALDLVEADPSEIKDFLPDLQKSAQHGLDIIKMVRDIEALDSKKNLLSLADISLADALKESSRMLAGRLGQKKLDLELNVTGNIKVKAERVSLVNSVLNNILTNAIKFSPENSKIVITNERADAKVILRIRDFGVGMPAELVSSVFDVSKKTSRKGTAGESGTGFGMPLVKKFMNAYGGEIDVQSWEKASDSESTGTMISLSFNVA